MNGTFFKSLFSDCKECNKGGYAETGQTPIEIENSKMIIKETTNSKISQAKITAVSYGDGKT